MDKLKESLDYFIQYEWSNRLQSIELKKNAAHLLNISREQLADVNRLKEMLWKRKSELLEEAAARIKAKTPYTSQELAG